MKEKIKIIILVIIFILLLLGIKFLLNKETNKKINNSSIENEYTNTNKEEKEIENMNIIKVSNENFEEEVLNSDKVVLIDFFADWCGPCKMLSPIIEKISNENQNIKVVKINVDEAQDIAMKYQVMSIPTLVVIKDGEEVNRSVGLVSQADIEKMIK